MNRCLEFQEIKGLQAAVDMKMYVYLPGPRLLDQFPFAGEAVCACVCICVRVCVGNMSLQQALQCGAKQRKIPELKQQQPALFILCSLDMILWLL